VALNWFEGGRRITKLLMASAALIGTYNAYFEFTPPPIELWTAAPFDVWHLSSPLEDEKDFGEGAATECNPSEIVEKYELTAGLVRDIKLCVTGGLTDAEVIENLTKRGKIDDFDVEGARTAEYSDKEIAVYLFSSLRLDDDKKRLKDVEAALSRAKRAADPKGTRELTLEGIRLRAVVKQRQEKLNLLSSEFSSGSETEPFGWEDQRIAEFEIEPDMVVAIEKELPRIERHALFEHAKEVLSIAAYFAGGFWIFSFIMGWIVRGFAGIPRGQDFRPEPLKQAD
jgi:hypothetical protein